MLEPGNPPSRWMFPNPAKAAGGRELLAIGGDLEPSTLVDAYARGLFPMPLSPGTEVPIGWISPDPRGILPVDSFHVSRSLRRNMRRFTFTVDRVFDEVVAGCADPDRTNGWIDDRMVAAYHRLHEVGLAHSIEVWAFAEQSNLAGGLFGVEINGLFAAESMFHRVTDASKAAVAELVRVVSAGDHPKQRLIDVQWLTPHLERLGARAIGRPDYLDRLRCALALQPVFGSSPI
ncbi:MAG: leucyl/phenylalanyl-tRNA--protein transferase [Candidatus Nanopelagicales bacterium]|nr:leucyl/phenylalanyl-tRNA--protein transferase [Candidatus Nanopelagicales bacterium]